MARLFGWQAGLFPSPLAGEGGSRRRQVYAVCASLTARESERDPGGVRSPNATAPPARAWGTVPIPPTPMTAERSCVAPRAGLARPTAPSVQFTCQTAMRNPPRPLVGAAVAVVSPASCGGRFPSKAEGAERRVAPRVFRCTPWRACASPWRRERCALRRSARRWTACGGGSPFDDAFPALALVVAGIGSELNRVGSFCPRADPRAARAPCLQGTKAQAPHPAPPPDASRSALE